MKVFHDVLDRKLAFLDDKNMELKTGQNLHFSKRVSPRFLSKISLFFLIFCLLDQIGLKSLLRCSRYKISLSIR